MNFLLFEHKVAFMNVEGMNNTNEKPPKITLGDFFVWRRRRDLNPCASCPTYSLSRGAPSPLGYFSINIFIFS